MADPAPFGSSLPHRSAAAIHEERYARARASMVEHQIAAMGITDTSVLDAMRSVPRHLFVPEEHRREAYEDYPLPIGHGQTISQPFIVAAMTAALRLLPKDRVLEIGTGSGYQAAVLAELCRQVFSIEIIDPLARHAIDTFAKLGYRNIEVRIGDGYNGWPEQSPFDCIILTAAPNHIPQPLIDQLVMGGRMVLPLGDREQTMVILRKTPQGVTREDRYGVRFVPMTGQAEERS